MGRNTLDCKHDVVPFYEDDVLFGYVWAGHRCSICKIRMPSPPHPGDAIALGVYK